MAEEKKAAAEESGGKKPNLLENKAILLGAIVIVQALVAIGLTQFVILPKLGVQGADMNAAQVEDDAQEIPEMGVLVGLEEIIVSLENTGGKTRYLRIDINLEVGDGMIAEVVKTRLPQLRDMVIMACSEKTADELSTPEGKKGLRDEIFRRVAEKMPAGALMNVYFSDMIVQ